MSDQRWQVVRSPTSDPRGRRIVAQVDIEAGQIVLEEAPYACVLNSDQVNLRCGCCLQPPLSDTILFKCTGCNAAYYINRDHQKRAWNAGHKLECKVLSTATQNSSEKGPLLPPATVRLAIKTVLKAYTTKELLLFKEDQNQYPDGGQHHVGGIEEECIEPPQGLEGVLSLQSHWESISDSSKIKFAHMGAWAWNMLRTSVPEVALAATPRDLAFLVARFSCNSHTICNDELHSIGMGIFPLVSMANHSCAPTCAQSFLPGGRAVLRSIRKIRAGEDITIAYVELAAPRWERRAQLLQNYLFDIDAGASEASEPPREASTPGQSKSLENQQQQDSQLLVHEHHSCSHPPWPHDTPRDLELSAVEISSASGASIDDTLLQCGIWGVLEDSDKVQQERDAASFALELAQGSGPWGGESLTELESSDNSKGNQKEPQSCVTVHTWSATEWNGLDNSAITNFVAQYAAAVRLLATHEADALNHKNRRQFADSLDVSFQTLTNSANGINLGPRHVLRIRLLAARLHALIECGGKWQEALEVSEQLLGLYEWAYPKRWPVLAIHLATQAKIEHLEGRLESAVEHAQRAVVMLEETMGLGGVEGSRAEVERVWREAAAEIRAGGGGGRLP